MALKFKTKQSAIYETLKKDILEGRLQPGQKIKISAVAKEFELSEIPVREAIRNLESDGLVNFKPYVGATVSQIDKAEFLETYLIRIELEALATKLATEHITGKEIAKLTHLNDKMGACVQENKPEKMGKLNRQFHKIIYQAAPYPYLNKLLDDLSEKVERTQSVFAYVPQRAQNAIEEHYQIIGAIKNREAEKAADLIRDQKNRTMVALKQYLEKNKI